MTTEENKAVVRREFEEMFNSGGNLGAAGTSTLPTTSATSPQAGDVRGIEGARQFAANYRAAFPDLEATIEDQLAEGDKVVTRFSGRGTHQGEIEDLGPATG